jgi:hypothetical protein
LPLALKKHGQSFEDVQEAAAWAMSILQAQANTISVNCKIGLTSAVIRAALPPTQEEASTHSEENSKQHQHSLDDDDEDDWSMDLQIPEEVVAISKTLGGIE